MQKVLIIGNGIAGASLAWTLHQAGVQVTLADAQMEAAASPLAAGVINPITGRRYVKTWKLDVLQPFAQQFYKEFEGHFTEKKIWKPLPIVRLLSSIKEQNEWAARSGDPAYAPWMGSNGETHFKAWKSVAQSGFYTSLTLGSAQVDLAGFCTAVARFFLEKDRFWQKKLEYNAIPDLKREFDAIVFCEGFRGKDNPFFPNLPWQVAKGEVLIIDFPGADLEEQTSMLKKEVMLVPIGENRFWAGANYEWNYTDTAPSALGRVFIEEKLKEMLSAPFRVLEHKSAIRPTAQHYRPFLGQSTFDEQVFMFNALGTKGALLAPYWAQHFSDFLLKKGELEQEVDWKTYQKTS